MTINHATMTTALATLPRTDFGIPITDDGLPSITEWWSMHPDADLNERPNLNVAGFILDAGFPQVVVDLLNGVREPDMCDDGRAYWMTADAVVSIDVERIDTMLHTIDMARRIKITDTGLSWARIAPSAYGIEVMSFHSHTGTPAEDITDADFAEQDAVSAWVHLANAIK